MDMDKFIEKYNPEKSLREMEQKKIPLIMKMLVGSPKEQKAAEKELMLLQLNVTSNLVAMTLMQCERKIEMLAFAGKLTEVITDCVNKWQEVQPDEVC